MEQEICDINNNILFQSFIDLINNANAKILNNNDRFILCKCRYGHKFKIQKKIHNNITFVKNEWCLECKNPEFNNELLISINEDLNEMESDIYIYKIDIYGNCKASCKKIHQLHFSIDDIQYSCPYCDGPNCISSCSITPNILNDVSNNSNHILSQLQYENESDNEYNYKNDIDQLHLNYDHTDSDKFEQIPDLELDTFIRKNSSLKLSDNHSDTDDTDIDFEINNYTDTNILILKELVTDENYISILESNDLESNVSESNVLKNNYRPNNLLEIIKYI